MATEQLRCTYCGGSLLDRGSFYICESCRTQMPKTVMEKLTEQDVFDLNTARQLKEGYCFQEAQVAYDEILQRNPGCEEAAWGAFLSEYGIEYQKQENKPTFHSLSEIPVYESRYYYRLSEGHQTEALNVIEPKRCEVLRLVEKLPSYDVFLSLKINNESGQKTLEYDWAMQLYYDLREEGYRVFFSPQVLKETNEDWEPHIYKAIQTCRIMLIFTSSLENINSPWVRNEWRRILSRIQNTPNDVDKPVYRVIAQDMNCIPPQLSGKQAIFRSDIHFSSLVLSAVKQACQLADTEEAEGERQRAKETDESGSEKVVTDSESVQAYLSRMRDRAFIVSPGDREKIIRELESKKDSYPEVATEFMLLIKRIQTDNINAAKRSFFDRGSVKYVKSKAESDEQLRENADYKALLASDLFAYYQSSKPTSVSSKKKVHINVINIIIIVACVAFTALGLAAFYKGRIFSGLLAGVQVAILIVAFFKKKTGHNMGVVLAIILSFVLIVPYLSLFKVDVADFGKYAWDEVMLADMLPMPESPYGKIISNSADSLSLDVKKTNLEQFEKYMDACKDSGFTIDSETKEGIFYAYNDEGYKLSLGYYDNKMHINLNAVEKYAWDEVVLADMLPKPESPYGKIISNSEDSLSLDVIRTSVEQFDDYLDACKDEGFTIDAETKGGIFYAYNDKGYKLSLRYQNNEMHISLDVFMKLGTLFWPDSEMAQQLPVPKSTRGDVQQNDKKRFIVYVGGITIEEYCSYVQACVDKGFIVDATRTEKSYSAKNAGAYKLSVEYKGGNIICISVDEPEFDVNIKIECVENFIFSKYDVKVYIDGMNKGTITHGGTGTYSLILTKGKHTIRFESAEDASLDGEVELDISKDDTLRFKISCSRSGIEVETIVDTSTT